MAERRVESPAGRPPSASSVASPALLKQDGSIVYDGLSAKIDVLTLIADYLERSTPLTETAAKLRSEVIGKKLLPTTLAWNGEERPGSLPHSRALRKLPPGHLLQVLTQLSPTLNPPVRSSDVLTSTLNFLLKNEQSQRVKLIQSSKPGTGISNVSLLADLRLEQRQLLRELKSEKGRGSVGLQERLGSVTSSISTVARGLTLSARLRKDSQKNVIDAFEDLSRPLQSSSARSMVRVSLSNLRILKKITGHRAPAYCCSSTHSKWIFTAADDDVVKLWNGENAQMHYAFRGHKNVITDLAATEHLIASASEDNSVRVWEIGSTKPFAVFMQHRQPVQRVQFSSDGQWLFTSAEDGACCVWNIESLRLQVNDREVSSKAWINRERERRRHAALNQSQNSAPAPLLTPEQEEMQLLIDCPRAPLVFEPPLVFPHLEKPGTIAKIVCMAVHPSGKFVATGSEDRLGRVWSVDEITAQPPPPLAETMPGLIAGDYIDGANRLLCTLSGHTEGFVHHIEWSHKGDRILTFSDKDGTARIWFWPFGDFASKPQHIALKAIGSSTETVGRGARTAKNNPMIDGAGWSRDDSFIVTTQSIKPHSQYKDEEPGFWDSRVCVWDSKSGTLLRFIRGHRAQAHVVRMHPELNWVAATCGADGLIIVWDIERGEQICRLDAISTEGYPSILDARWSPNQNHPGDFIATDSMGRLIIIGTGDSSCYAASPCEQFFSNERDAFVFDARTNDALDATLQIPLHLIRPRPFLVDVYEERYAHQPPTIPAGEGSYFGGRSAAPLSSYKQRLEQAAEKQRLVSQKENMVLQETSFKESIEKQDAAVQRQIQRDIEEQQEALTGVKSLVPFSAQKSKLSRPKAPKAQPVLALERAALEDSSGSEDEEDEEEAIDPSSGRARRAAARRATTRIHRHARHLIDNDPGSRLEDNNDPTYEEAQARRRRYDDDDDEEEEEELDLDDDSDEDEDSLDLDDDEEEFGGRSRRRNTSSRQTRVYQTRGNRVNYAHLDSDEAPTGGGSDDEDDGIGRRSNRQRVPSNRIGSPHSALIAGEVPEAAVDFSNEWLTQSSETPSYVPQVGDTVVYFPQGHAEYLRHFPSTESPPWQSWDVKVWPYVSCQVTDVEYVFPVKDEPKQILCRVSLRVVGVKAPVGGKDQFVAVPETIPEISFSVLYHSLEPEFLVLQARFLAGLRQTFSLGSRIGYYTRNEESPSEPQICRAIIRQIRVKDPEGWPDSPWEAVACDTVDPTGSEGATTQVLLSPWDVEVEETPETPLWRTIPEESQEFRDAEVEGKPAQEWIADEIDSCGLWSAFFRVQRHQSLPCPLSVSLVSERLRNGQYYRQWEAIDWDFRKVIESAIFGKSERHSMRQKADRFLMELSEILFYAQYQEDKPSPSYLPSDSLKQIVVEELNRVASADKEGFFAQPVDLEQLPDYLDHVSQPMDFATIRTRIEREIPRGTEMSFPRARMFIRSVVRDVRLIASNALAYNPEGTVAYRRARDVNKKMGQVFGQLDLDAIDQTQLRQRPTRARHDADVRVGMSSTAGSAVAPEVQTHVSSRGRVVRMIPSVDAAAEAVPDSLLDDSEEDDEDASDSEAERNHRRRGKKKRTTQADGTTRRGRPKRLASTDESVLSPIPLVHQDPASTAFSTGIKRVRIAMPQLPPDTPLESSFASQYSGESPLKRGRGRPRKYALPDPGSASSALHQRGRGQSSMYSLPDSAASSSTQRFQQQLHPTLASTRPRRGAAPTSFSSMNEDDQQFEALMHTSVRPRRGVTAIIPDYSELGEVDEGEVEQPVQPTRLGKGQQARASSSQMPTSDRPSRRARPASYSNVDEEEEAEQIDDEEVLDDDDEDEEDDDDDDDDDSDDWAGGRGRKKQRGRKAPSRGTSRRSNRRS